MSHEEKFVTKKSLGQHFLNSSAIPRLMCDAGQVNKTDTVVEIGAGTGILTKEILDRQATAIALEADERAIAILETKFANEIEAGQLLVKHVDVREFRPETLGLKSGSYKVVANIPYYLSGLLFRTFLDNKVQPTDLVFLVQKEVAKRICDGIEKGAKESLLSLSVKVFGEPVYIKTVSRGHFTPPPKVDSGIILVKNISRSRLGDLDSVFFFKMLHLGFGQKRKQLLGNLSVNFDRSEVEEIFNLLDIPPAIRAEDLSLEKWLKLAKKLLSVGV